MPQIDFLPVATGTGANVDTQVNFAGSGYQKTGFVSGIMLSLQGNKVWRQASFWGAVIANFVSQQLGGIDVLDNGDSAGALANFTAAVAATAGSAVGPAQINVAFNSGNMAFDCSLGSQIAPVFVVAPMTGDNASASLANQRNGQVITIVIQQDGVGGRNFTPPLLIPMSTVDMSPNRRSSQSFVVTTIGIIPIGPLIAI